MGEAPPRSRGNYRKTAQRRQDILQAAMEEFAERGYEASSVRQIAARVGISETGLLHHFGGKTQLLTAVLEAREHQEVGRLQDTRGVIPVRRLPELVARNALRRDLVRLFTNLAGASTSENSQAHGYFSDRYARIRGSLAERVRQSQDAGEIRPDLDPQVVAQVLLAVMDGMQVQWLYDESLDMAGVLDSLLSSWLVAR